MRMKWHWMVFWPNEFRIDETVWFMGEFEAPSKLCRSAYEILENFK
jgi:hypothetical protein